VKTLRAAWRALRAIAHVVRGLWIIRTEFGRLTPAQTQLVVREWSRGMLRIMGVELVVRGEVPTHGPLLVVANHLSWLDILVMNAAHPSRFVSKADVQRWPLLGSLITGAGTLYIERSSRRDALRMVRDMADAMKEGDVVAVFPEGTTSDGRELLPFHANLIQSAIAAEVPVQPMSLCFVDTRSGEMTLAPCYIGDDTLVGSVWRTLTAGPITAVVNFGEPQQAEGRDRRQWAQDLRETVIALRDQV